MKNTFCLILILSPLCLLAQTQTTCVVPQKIINSYQNDVKVLAAELMLASQLMDANSISIIPTYENVIWKGLATIINNGSSNLVDTIFNIACIKKRFANDIYITYNPNAAWIQEWMADNETINNTEAANILYEYCYQVKFLKGYPGVALRFDEILNLKPLSNLLNDIEDFKSVEFNMLAGDGNDISVMQNGEKLAFKFKLGWGDCPSGCYHKRLYEFVVDISTCTLISETASCSPINKYVNSFSNCNLINIK